MNYRVDREEADQQALIYWVHTQEERHPELKLLHHIPNGGHRSKTTAIRMKRLGVRRGVPDLCLPVPKQERVEKDGRRYARLYPGLYIEMKAPGGSKRSAADVFAAGGNSQESTVPDLRKEQSASPRGGALSKEQKEFIGALEYQGYCCKVCYSYEQAREVIEWYIGLDEMPLCIREE